jgi:hypothetical protein
MGIQDAHICLNELEIPNDLFPIINRIGIIKPIKGPATYHGQGFCKNSNIFFKLFFCEYISIKKKEFVTNVTKSKITFLY